MLLAVMIILRNLALFAICLAQEADVSDFNDLGVLLFGGFVLALGVAIAFTFVKLRLRDKKPPRGEFISINPLQEKSEELPLNDSF